MGTYPFMPPARQRSRTRWTADKAGAAARSGPPRPHATEFPGATEQARDIARKNFLALIFCLMVGTAGLPHLLTRYYTTSSVKTARESVAWSLVFICLLYLTAPALAVMVKTEVFNGLVGSSFDQLPAWIRQWQRVDPGLLSAVDLNGDGRLQLGELRLHPDLGAARPTHASGPRP